MPQVLLISRRNDFKIPDIDQFHVSNYHFHRLIFLLKYVATTVYHFLRRFRNIDRRYIILVGLLRNYVYQLFLKSSHL